VRGRRKSASPGEAMGPSEITRYLLATLVSHANIHLLVGTRPDTTARGRRFEGLGSATLEIDLDSDQYFQADDILNYAAKRLCDEGPTATPTNWPSEPRGRWRGRPEGCS
jgi:hypothetical protein